MRKDQLVLGRERVELIFRRAEVPARDVGDFLRDLHIEALGGVESRADSCAAQRELAKPIER